MTQEQSIFERVQEMIVDRFGVQEDKVTTSMTFDDLGADSLDVVEMLMTLEDEFNVTVSDEESVNLKTVGDIVKLIDSKTKKN